MEIWTDFTKGKGPRGIWTKTIIRNKLLTENTNWFFIENKFYRKIPGYFRRSKDVIGIVYKETLEVRGI